MIRITELSLPLDHPADALRPAIAKRLKISDADLLDFTVFKRSYDARKKNSVITFVYIIDLAARNEAAILQRFADDPHVRPAPDTNYYPVAGTADLTETARRGGLRALRIVRCAAARTDGFQTHRARTRPRRATAHRRHLGAVAQETLTPESNVQFGEGGAGLFSDGKLYSQIKDPKFYGRKVMHEFVRAGAPEEIMYVSKPHIGTFRLTGVVARMREEIIALGGEVRFESRVTDLLIDAGQIEA